MSRHSSSSKAMHQLTVSTLSMPLSLSMPSLSLALSPLLFCCTSCIPCRGAACASPIGVAVRSKNRVSAFCWLFFLQNLMTGCVVLHAKVPLCVCLCCSSDYQASSLGSSLTTAVAENTSRKHTSLSLYFLQLKLLKRAPLTTGTFHSFLFCC